MMGYPPGYPPQPPANPFAGVEHQLSQITRLLEAQGAILMRQASPSPEQADISIGNGYSGITPEIGFEGEHGGPQQVFAVNFPARVNGGACGLASVHVHAYDVRPLFQGEQTANAMLVGNLAWQSGRGGGSCRIDLTRGCFFTVGASTALTLSAQFIAVDDEATVIRPWATKKVEATISMQGSINPKAAKATLPSVALVKDVPSSFFPIPAQAESMIGMTTDPASLSALTAELATSSIGTGAGIRARVLDPFTNGCPIWHGFEFVRFVTTSATAQRVFPGFELWI